MNENAKQMKDEMKTMRGEMRQVGQCLQAGRMATPRELRGSAPAGEDRAIRETCWARRGKVTETVTRTLKGEETTSTRETRREVTELTDAGDYTGGRGETARGRGRRRTHTYTHTGSEGQWG